MVAVHEIVSFLFQTFLDGGCRSRKSFDNAFDIVTLLPVFTSVKPEVYRDLVTVIRGFWYVM